MAVREAMYKTSLLDDGGSKAEHGMLPDMRLLALTLGACTCVHVSHLCVHVSHSCVHAWAGGAAAFRAPRRKHDISLAPTVWSPPTLPLSPGDLLHNDAELHTCAMAVVKGLVDAEGCLSSSMGHDGLGQVCSVVSASPAMCTSLAELLHCTLGLQPADYHLYARQAEAEREEGYMPDGQRHRAMPEPPPDEAQLQRRYKAELVSGMGGGMGQDGAWGRQHHACAAGQRRCRRHMPPHERATQAQIATAVVDLLTLPPASPMPVPP